MGAIISFRQDSINFSIYMVEKLVCKLGSGNSLINVFSRRIDIYD